MDFAEIEQAYLEATIGTHAPTAGMIAPQECKTVTCACGRPVVVLKVLGTWRAATIIETWNEDRTCCALFSAKTAHDLNTGLVLAKGRC